jgi:hypothetical protein
MSVEGERIGGRTRGVKVPMRYARCKTVRGENRTERVTLKISYVPAGAGCLTTVGDSPISNAAADVISEYVECLGPSLRRSIRSSLILRHTGYLATTFAISSGFGGAKEAPTRVVKYDA